MTFPDREESVDTAPKNQVINVAFSNTSLEVHDSITKAAGLILEEKFGDAWEIVQSLKSEGKVLILPSEANSSGKSDAQPQ